MGKVAATALAAVCAFVPSTAYAQVPSLGEALGFAGAGFGALIAAGVVAYLIARAQFPNDAGWRAMVTLALVITFVGLGGMDWFTFGEWQGMPWETFDGQARRYTPGVGWSH